MALVAKTARDASGATFVMLFDDTDVAGLTPASVIVGPAADDLAAIAAAVSGALTVRFPVDQPQQIGGTVDFVPVGNVPVTAAGNFPVINAMARVVWTQTVVTGTGSAVTVLPANANRKGVAFLPAGAANDAVYNFFGTAASGASPIYPPAGGPFVLSGTLCPTGALSIQMTAGQKLIVWEAN